MPKPLRFALILLGVAVLVLLAGITALALVPVAPPPHAVEKTVPNDTLPR